MGNCVSNSSNSSDCVSESYLSTIVYYSVYLTFFSSFLAIFGSCMIILTFILWKDVRSSMARIVLLFLAIADLGSGLGYFTSSVGYLFIYNSNNNHTVDYNSTDILRYYCKGVSFVTTFFPVSSFFWTGFLAVYFVVALVLRKPRWSKKLIIMFNMIAWGVPLIICTVASALGILGSSESRTTGGWCFVSQYLNNHQMIRYPVYLGFEAICGKGWELVFYVTVLVCYSVIIVVNKRWFPYKKSIVLQDAHPPLLDDPQKKDDVKRKLDYVRISTAASNSLSQQTILNQAISKVDLKLLAIPLVFIALRLPGTYRYFLSMTAGCYHQNETDCQLTKACFCTGGNYIPVLFLHSFCDPLQGFGNAVLFVFMSKPIVLRFFRCCKRAVRRDKASSISYQAKSPSKTEYRVTYSPSLKKLDDSKEMFSEDSLLNSLSPDDYGSLQRSNSATSINK